MDAGWAERDPELEKLERDSFIFLQHIYTLTGGDPADEVSGARAAEELGFTASEADPLIRHLIRVELLRECGVGPKLCITPAGVGYIERLAWRRRSVRLTPGEFSAEFPPR